MIEFKKKDKILLKQLKKSLRGNTEGLSKLKDLKLRLKQNW